VHKDPLPAPAFPWRIAYLIIGALASFGSAVAQRSERESTILPHYETMEEQRLKATYLPPPAVSLIRPPNPVRTMAEFEECEGIVVRWTYNEQNLLLSQIVSAAQQEGKVWILVRPGTSDSTNIKTYLTGRSIPLINLEFLPISTNSIWCRDYGPWTVYDVTNDSMAIIDFRYNRSRPLDDVVPVALSSLWDVPLYQTVQGPDSLAHTGGNFMVDGFGTGFSSRLIINENPHLAEPQVDTILAAYCGINRFVKMNTLLYDQIHHIDMHMKLLDEETLLIGQYPPNVSDYATIENTVNYLRTLTTCYGRAYRIIRIPMPPSLSGQYPPNSNYYTYTNSLIINKTVLVPIYGFPQDQQALQIYRDAMPGYTVVGYDCNAIIPQLGAIHCISKEIGIREPVHIAHPPLANTADTLHDYRIEARIHVRSGVDSAFVRWRTDSTGTWTQTLLTDSSGVLIGSIPVQHAATTVWYYISAKTGSGRWVNKPLVAPSGTYRFEVRDSSVTSVAGIDVPSWFWLSQNYPNPFNPTTTIRFSIPVGTYGHTSLRVYDLLGREVVTLVNEVKQPGSYEVTWDATRFATGVYLYRMNAGSFVQTKRLVLLR
jgi:agmatine deiminase